MSSKEGGSSQFFVSGFKEAIDHSVFSKNPHHREHAWNRFNEAAALNLIIVIWFFAILLEFLAGTENLKGGH